MKSRVFTLAIFSLLLLCGIGTARPTSANPTTQTDDYHLYLPMIANGLQAIVVDHRHTDISQIPDYWIEQARNFVVHYAHTSHGSQVLSGLGWLEGRNSLYNVDIEASGTVVLPDDTTALRVYDGNNYMRRHLYHARDVLGDRDRQKPYPHCGRYRLVRLLTLDLVRADVALTKTHKSSNI